MAVESGSPFVETVGDSQCLVELEYAHHRGKRISLFTTRVSSPFMMTAIPVIALSCPMRFYVIVPLTGVSA